MVLFDLGRLVPALRRALMLAYRPGLDLFITAVYHASCSFQKTLEIQQPIQTFITHLVVRMHLPLQHPCQFV
jgi:hypothetical protein